MINKIQASVLSLESCGILHVTNFAFNNSTLSMISLELENVKIQDRVILTAKPTAISIAKEFSGAISCSNQLKGSIFYINYGTLLTEIIVLVDNVKMSVIITTSLAKSMDLKKNDIVTCFIKASDLSIYERL